MGGSATQPIQQSVEIHCEQEVSRLLCIPQRSASGHARVGVVPQSETHKAVSPDAVMLEETPVMSSGHTVDGIARFVEAAP